MRSRMALDAWRDRRRRRGSGAKEQHGAGEGEGGGEGGAEGCSQGERSCMCQGAWLRPSLPKTLNP